MEDLCRRFPLVAQNVFANLDDKSLTDCKVVSKVSYYVLNNERFFWIRIIKRYFPNQSQFYEEWKTAISRTPTAILKQIATAVDQICKKEYYQCMCSYWSPLHITAMYGNFTLFRYIFEKMTVKNPKGFRELTPLHLAAMYEHHEVRQFIIKNITDDDLSIIIRGRIQPLNYSAIVLLLHFTWLLRRDN